MKTSLFWSVLNIVMAIVFVESHIYWRLFQAFISGLCFMAFLVYLFEKYEIKKRLK